MATQPALIITQTPSPHGTAASQQATVTASVTFHSPAPGQSATAVLTTPGTPGRSGICQTQ